MSDLLLENPEFIKWVAGRGDSKRKEERWQAITKTMLGFG